MGLSSEIHLLDGTLRATEMTLRDAGALVVKGGSAELMSCTLECNVDHVVSVWGSAQVQFTDCYFNVRGTAVSVVESGRLEARECTFEKSHVGLELHTEVAAWVDKCHFDAVGTAIHLQGQGTRHQFTANTFVDCGICVDAHGLASPDILGNEFRRASRSGVETHNNAAPYLEGNLFADNVEFAIRALGRSKPEVALNAFRNNGGRLHMDATAYAVRYAPVEEWKPKRAFTPSVHSVGTPPALVPRLPRSEPTRMRQYHHLRWVASVISVVGWMWAAPLAAAAGIAYATATVILATTIVGLVVATSLSRRRDRRLLVRGWWTRGQVVNARFGVVQVQFADRDGTHHVHWTWLPRARKGQTVDILFDAGRPSRFIPLLPGSVRFGRDDAAADNRTLLAPPADGSEAGELTAALWDGPTTNSTALEKTPGGIVERLRAKRARARASTRPTALGKLTVRDDVLQAPGARVDLGRPFTLTATTWPTNPQQAEIYLQISGRVPGTDDRVTTGVRTLLPQVRISSDVPSQQRLWPWIQPDEFEPFYAHLVHLNRIHGGTPPPIATHDDTT